LADLARREIAAGGLRATMKPTVTAVQITDGMSIDRAIAKLKKMSDDASGLRVDAQATSST